MFKSRTNHLHGLISEDEKSFLAQVKTGGQQQSAAEFFQLELTIEKVSIDAASLQQTNVEISPYLMIKVNGVYKQRTKAKRNNLNPTFNQTFLLSFENPNRDVIHIYVHDKERNGETIGFCTIDHLNQFNFGNMTSLVLDLETPGIADMTRSSIFSDGVCGSIQVDVKPLNFGATEKESSKLIGKKKVKNESPDKSNSSSPVPGMAVGTASGGGGAVSGGGHEQHHQSKKKSDNKPHFDLPPQEDDEEEPLMENDAAQKRKSRWFGVDPLGTPTNESSFNFDDLNQVANSTSMGEDHLLSNNGPNLIQIEGEKEFTKTKQQFKLLYVMAMDIQMFGERVNKIEALLEKWKDFENDTEKIRNSIQSGVMKADKKRELLDKFIPKLSKKLPQVTNCKLTIMKLTKLRTQYENIDKQYQNLLKTRQKIERHHKKKRSERMMEFDELMDHVLYQTAPTTHHQNSKKSKERSSVIPSPTVNTSTSKDGKVDRNARKKEEQVVKKKQFMQAIMAGARDSGATNPDHLAKKYEEKQMELQQRKEQAQQQKVQFILSTADAETIEMEKKIALETKAELEAVEKDYAELHEMYEQMNYLIRDQGQGLNIIEKNIQQANEYVKEGTEYVKAASACTTTGILTGGFTKAAVLKKLIS